MSGYMLCFVFHVGALSQLCSGHYMESYHCSILSAEKLHILLKGDLNMDEVKIIPSWMDEQKITMPLTEFLALKMKIVNLQNEIEKVKKEADDQRSEKWAVQGALDRLKKDYQELLKIGEEGENENDTE